MKRIIFIKYVFRILMPSLIVNVFRVNWLSFVPFGLWNIVWKMNVLLFIQTSLKRFRILGILGLMRRIKDFTRQRY